MSRPSILRSSTRETGRPETTGFAGTACGSRREPNALTFYAGADDGVIVRVDGDTVLERNPAVGMHTVARTVELAAGAHRLEIEHWQDGGGRSLNAAMGARRRYPGAPEPDSSIPRGSGRTRLLAAVAAMRLPVLVLLVWATGVAVLVGLTVWRAFYRRVTSLSPDERWRRLRTVLFPALLGPSQLLLFGPWTVHETNRTEFLVGFWELAPGWVWLIGPVVGVLAGLSIVMPARWFPRYVAALCAVGVLLWAQGNLLLADYGLLDGGGLDLASHAWRTPFETGLWVCVLLLAVIFADRVARVAPVACVALVTLQATVLWSRSAEWRRSTHRRRQPPRPPGGCRRQRSTNSQHAQPHPHRARHVPDTHVRRHPGRRPARLRSRLARLHLLRQSPRRPPKHASLHARDALGRRLS